MKRLLMQNILMMKQIGLPRSCTNLSDYKWTGSTWVGGVNTPTTGNQLFTNGDLETWSDANTPGTWGVTANGSSTMNRESSVKHSGSYAARFDVDSADSDGSNVGLDQTVNVSIGDWVRVSVWVKSSKIASHSFQEGGGTQKIYFTTPLGGEYVKYVFTRRASAAENNFIFKRDTAPGTSLYYDDIDGRVVTNIHKLQRFNSTYGRVKSKWVVSHIHSPCGPLMCADSLTNPQNGVYVFWWDTQGGQQILLQKQVNGTWTNLQSINATYVANYNLVLRRETNTNTFKVFYGPPGSETQIGTDQTVADASIISNTIHGILSVDPDNYCTGIDYNANIESGILSHPGGWFYGITGNNAWAATQREDASRLVEVYDVFRKGTSSVKFTVQTGDNVGGERSEVYGLIDSAGNDLNETDNGEFYYATSVKLDADFPVSPWLLVVQLHGPDAYNTSPVFAIAHKNGLWYVELRVGDLDTPGLPYPSYALAYGACNYGHWTDFIFRIKYAMTPTGEIDVWTREEGETSWRLALSVRDIITRLWKTSLDGGVPGPAYWKCGIYRDPTEGSVTHILWNNGLARGTDFKTVEDSAF